MIFERFGDEIDRYLVINYIILTIRRIIRLNLLVIDHFGWFLNVMNM